MITNKISLVQRHKSRKRKFEEEEMFLKSAMNHYFSLLSTERQYFGRANYNESTWGRMMRDPRIADPTCKQGRFFRTGFRVPFPIFENILSICREFPDIFPEGKFDCVGHSAAPLDLLVLGALRVLGRGMCFSGIYELNGISEEKNRTFFHKFCAFFAETQFPIFCASPSTNEDLQAISDQYEPMGFPGCAGCGDVVHIPWDRSPYRLRSYYSGKENFPTVAFEVFCTNDRRIIACSRSFSGAMSDKTIVKFDQYVTAVLSKDLFKNFQYKLHDSSGNEIDTQGCYVIVDNGYFRIRILQCPEKITSSKPLLRLSKWLESIRKSIECVFGIMKGRFRILKIPILYQEEQMIENVFKTCCVFHNILLAHDALVKTWEENIDYEGSEGLHDFADFDRILNYYQIEVRVSKALDLSNIGNQTQEVEKKDSFEDLNGFRQLRNLLMTHFNHLHEKQEVIWKGVSKYIPKKDV